MSSQSVTLGSVTLANPLVLAPMAGITQLPLRRLAKEQGCALVVSEMISANGLVHGGQKTLELLKSHPSERPLSVQIFGRDPGVMKEAAQIVQGQGADLLDINLGCSVRKVVRQGAGAALMGKHIDKLDMDAELHIRTLPVLLGESLARYVTLFFVVLQYLIVVYLMVIGFFTPLMLIVFLSLPMFVRIVLPMYRAPKPVERPPDYPDDVWPLWYVASAFAFSRRFGLLFVLGLLFDTLLQLVLR